MYINKIPIHVYLTKGWKIFLNILKLIISQIKLKFPSTLFHLFLVHGITVLPPIYTRNRNASLTCPSTSKFSSSPPLH